MRVCKICQKPIENLHGNADTCISCRKKPNAKKIIVHHEQVVTTPIKQFRELERLAKLGRRYENITKLFESYEG
ncbi:hypothetical protein N9924_00920 [bacterium]|nr:hypothetical protein [bacterium]